MRILADAPLLGAFRSPMNPAAVVRWLLVVPAAASGFIAAFYAAMFAIGRESSWMFMVALGSAVIGAPVLVVIFGSAMAPSHRPAVAWIIYAGGLMVAAQMTRGLPMVLMPTAAAGACAAVFVQYATRRKETT